LLETIKSIVSSNLVVIMIVHDINWALAYADEVYFLKDGQLIANGEPIRVVNERLIEEVFHVNSKIVQVPHQSYPVVVY